VAASTEGIRFQANRDDVRQRGACQVINATNRPYVLPKKCFARLGEARDSLWRLGNDLMSFFSEPFSRRLAPR